MEVAQPASLLSAYAMHCNRSQKASRPNLKTWSYGFFGFGEKKWVDWVIGGVDTPWTAMTTRAPVMLIITVERSQ